MISPAEFIRREILDMTQTELGDALAVSQPRVSAWESGTGRIPQHHRAAVRRLANQKGREITDDLWDRVPLVKGFHGRTTC